MNFIQVRIINAKGVLFNELVNLDKIFSIIPDKDGKAVFTRESKKGIICFLCTEERFQDVLDRIIKPYN
jgi:hypothetical protein